MASVHEINARDMVREHLRAIWLPITEDRVNNWITTEPLRMYEAAKLQPVMTFEEFQRIDDTCMGHIDWFSKLTLRIADEVVGLK